MKRIPTTSPASLVRLGVSMAGASLRPRGDRAQALHDWLRRQIARSGSDDIVLNLLFKKVLLVTGTDLSAHILEQPPDVDGFAAGKLKTEAMAFLAPRALTISNGENWTRRRAYNEQVLQPARPHEHQQALLGHVNAAFARPATSTPEIRERMGRVMLGVVFDGVAPAGLPHDVDTLMGVVQSPLRRRLLGWRYRSLKRHFYETLRRQRSAAPAPSLVASGLVSEDARPDETIEQIPHWMFTFTGSGTDLLTRTLALVGSRTDVAERVVAEIAAAGPLDDAATIEKLEYLEACLRETGRLFPPVTKTFHVAPQGASFEGRTIPAGMEIVHYFPLLQRDTERDATADEFRPERWMGGETGSAGASSYLFLGGARTCPGEDLILFTCKSALALLIGRHGVRADAPALAVDPLPLTYPRKQVRIHVGTTPDVGPGPAGTHTTDDKRPARWEDMTQGSTDLTYADLTKMSQSELDDLYRGIQSPGSIPVGDTRGTALLLPGRSVGEFIRAAVRLLWWQGKVFNAGRSDLKNKISPLGFPSIRAKVYWGDSWMDDDQATIIDYSETSLVARFVRDEIREVSPGLWLGKVFLWKWHALDFTLTA